MAVTGVIVDRWALVRLGMAAVLRPAGVRIVAEADSASDGLLALRHHGAGLLIVGLADDVAVADLVGQAKAMSPRPAVVFLASQLDRAELDGLLALGIDGVLVRSAAGDELAGAVGAVLAGERYLSPAVLALAAQGAEHPFATDQGDQALLTTKEREVLSMLASGSTNKDIAAALFVTPATVKTHLSHIYSKLGVTGRQEAVGRAVALGLLA